MQDHSETWPAPAEEPKKRTYASALMAKRRQRIIDEAHKLMGKGGEHALTIEKLSRQAEVAPRTIYRLFGDKEGIIFTTVAERLSEVRAEIAKRNIVYTIDAVFAELDWMVSEMYRDYEFAKVVIDFYFSPTPRLNAIEQLRSVAYNRFRNWLDKAIRDKLTVSGLDFERLGHELVDNEFLVYHRWAFRNTSRRQCELELRANFLKTAVLIVRGRERSRYLEMLAHLHDDLGRSEIYDRASNNRAERDAGLHFSGKL